MASSKTRTFRFIDSPPERNMKRKSPESAPRLFEWLVDNGYAEPVTTNRSSKSKKGGSGRGGANKKKKKQSPF